MVQILNKQVPLEDLNQVYNCQIELSQVKNPNYELRMTFRLRIDYFQFKQGKDMVMYPNLE